MFSPLFKKVQYVYKGEAIFIDYKSGLDPIIVMQYSTPSGRRLIHQSTVSVNPPQLVVWGLHKFAPWHKRFNEVRYLNFQEIAKPCQNPLGWVSPQNFKIFGPPPPCHVQNSRNLIPFVCFLGTPLAYPLRTSFMEAPK